MTFLTCTVEDSTACCANNLGKTGTGKYITVDLRRIKRSTNSVLTGSNTTTPVFTGLPGDQTAFRNGF